MTKDLNEQDEINDLATFIVQEVVKAAKQKVDQKVLKDDLIEKTAYKVVNDAMKDATREDIDLIKKSALILVNQVIKEVCCDDEDTLI